MNDRVKIVSLNIQHGWNTSGSMPLPLRKRDVLANLDGIAKFLAENKPDVVLLQEVDRVSPITRKIDQLGYLASRVGYLHHVHGSSNEWRIGKRVVYSAGCGILSRLPILSSEHVRFESSPPTFRKGFLVATLALSETKTLTVASVHLPPFDILNIKSRRSHIEHMVKVLQNRGPIIIGGDLNMSFSVLNRSNIHALAKLLNVRTHESVFDPSFATYPAHDPRRKIDWIFSSPELAMTEYSVFRERISDHLAIGTTVAV